MSFLELSLTITSDQQPRAESVLEAAGALSITLMDADAGSPGEAAILEPGVGDTPLWPSLLLLALFDSDADRRGVTRCLIDALPELLPGHIAYHEVDDQDWERAWMDRYQPMAFGKRLWIYPWNIEPSGESAPHPLPSPQAGEGE